MCIEKAVESTIEQTAKQGAKGIGDQIGDVAYSVNGDPWLQDFNGKGDCSTGQCCGKNGFSAVPCHEEAHGHKQENIEDDLAVIVSIGKEIVTEGDEVDAGGIEGWNDRGKGAVEDDAEIQVIDGFE